MSFRYCLQDRALRRGLLAVLFAVALVPPAYVVEAEGVNRADHPAYGQNYVEREQFWTLELESTNQSPTTQTQDYLSREKESGVGWVTDWALQDPPAQWLMMLTSAIAIVLIYLTFRETRKTVELARQSTKAAQDSVAVMQSAAERQLRAYLSVVGANIQFDKESLLIRIYVEVKNTGQTPARNMRHSGAHSIGEPGEFFTPAVKSTDPTVDVGAGVPMHFSDYTKPVTEATFQAILHGGIKFYAFGAIYYRDVFGHEHITKYRLHLFEENRLVPCSEGNECT